MATTLSLDFTRFVAQVSNGSVRAKSASLAMMADNEEALKVCDWHEASAKASDVAMPGNNIFEAAGYLDDRYDAFIQGGKGNLETAEFEGYAGMVAYRFKLPSAYLGDDASSVGLQSFSATVSRDRYLRAGVRVVAALSASAFPSTEWATVRGEGSTFKTSSTVPSEATEGARSHGFMNQIGVSYLIDTRNADETLTIPLTGIDATKAEYLWIYLTLEDYQNRWLWRSEKVKREYWIEGAAMLVGSSNAVTFSGDVAEDTDARVIEPGGVSPECLDILTTSSINVSACRSLPTTVATTLGYNSYLDLSLVVCSPNVTSYMDGMSDSASFQKILNACGNAPKPGVYTYGNGEWESTKSHRRTIAYNGFGILHPAINMFPHTESGYTYNPIMFKLPHEVNSLSIPFVFARRGDENEQTSNRQAGLSVWAKCKPSPNVYMTYYFAGGSDDNRDSYLTYGSMAFLQISPLLIRSQHSGVVLTLEAISAVANTGIKTKFLIYKMDKRKMLNNTALTNACLPLLNPGFVRNESIGSVVHIDDFVDPSATEDNLPAYVYNKETVSKTDYARNYFYFPKGLIVNEELGNFDVKLVGISSEISTALAAGDRIAIKCSERIDEGDWLMILPMPTGIIDTNIDSYHFGRQSNPNVSTHGGFWARYTENLGWFPKITIS